MVQLEADTSESNKDSARGNGDTQLPIDNVQLEKEPPKLREILTSNDEENVDRDFDFSPLRSRKIRELASYPTATVRALGLSTTSNNRNHPPLKISSA